MAVGSSTAQSDRRRGTIVEALNRDWDELVDRHRGLVRGWSRGHGALAECHSLADVLLAARGQPDAVLAALLTEVSKGDHLAARVVLQAMLGRIVRMAGRDPVGWRGRLRLCALVPDLCLSAGSPADPDRRQPLDGHVQGRVLGEALVAEGRRDALAAGGVLGRAARTAVCPGRSPIPSPQPRCCGRAANAG